MKKFFHSAGFKTAVIFICVALIGCVAAAAAADGSSPFSKVLGTVFSPLQKAAAYISDSLSDFSGSFVSSGYYRKENERLQDEIADLREQLVDYEQSKQKLDSYKEFLGLKEKNPDYKFVSASVIARDTADMFYSFVLDCGSADGVEKNDPVIYGSYLAGVVKEVRTSSCVVETFMKSNINVSVYEVRSREEGYVSGTAMLAADGKCRMSGLSGNTAVANGGIVCTSGIGGVYPRDLIVGTVEEVNDETVDISSYAVLTPGIDFNELTDVFVLTDFAGKGE